MTRDHIEIYIGPAMRAVVADLAYAQDISIGQFVRSALSKEISRLRNAKPPVRADEQLIAPLRARLADDLGYALGWRDLDRRLKAKGYELRAAGGGLTLHRRDSGQRLCKASELGFSYSRLMRRFQQPFPGHAHTWLADRMLSSPSPTNNDNDNDGPAIKRV